MNVVVKGAIVLAIAVAVVSLAVALSGMHTNPLVGGFGSIGLFIMSNVAVIIWTLRQTADQNPYGKQLLNGLLLGVIAGALAFGFSMLMLTVLFPNYLEEMADGTIAWMENSGMTEQQIDVQIEKLETLTPLNQAATGMFFTIVTSVATAAVAAIFFRRK